MGRLRRLLRHLMAGQWLVTRHFPPGTLDALTATIRAAETGHRGELRLAVEAGLDWPDLWRGTSPRARALEVFSQLRVWDTEHNSGVLIYLLLADRALEIVADRGIHARVGEAAWATICRDMQAEFRGGDLVQGVRTGIDAIAALLRQHFPAAANDPNELDDLPTVL